MQKFTYRTPRFPVDLPIRLTIDGMTLDARCREISREGLQLEVREPLPPNYRGTVSLVYQNLALELPVEHAHSGSSQEGLKFVFSSEKQRSEVAQLVSILAANRGPSGLILVK
ncbi:MAG: PilZ domain-containing protein [Acidobacteriaceae bacterium]